MRHQTQILLTAAVLAVLPVTRGFDDDDFAAPLPPGVQAVWDVGSAERATTATRARFERANLKRNCRTLSRTGRYDGDAEAMADSLYLDQPEKWDDPYRFFRW